MPLSNLQSDANNFAYKQTAIIIYSNCVAFFDFLIYLYLADIIALTFFPANDNPLIAKLQVLSVFAAGYLSRPIGALVLGRYGDLKGRKPAYLISSGFIALTSLVTACLPSYAQVGVLAPILFVIARMIQGMAFGAHSALGWIYISEHVPKPNMAFFSSLITASFMMGVIATLISFNLLYSTYTTEQLVSYAWRIPFIGSSIFSLLAFFLGRYLKETPVFLNQNAQLPYLSNYKNFSLSLKRFNAIFITLLLSFYISSLVLVIALLLPNLILLKFSIDASMLGFSNSLGILFLILGCVFFGLIADKGNTGKALMFGSIALALQSLAFFYHLQNGDGDYILVMYALLGFCAGVIALGPVIMVQLFPTRMRFTSVAVTYNATYALVGAVLPFALDYATESISFSPALYLTFLGIIGFIIGLYIFRLPKFANLNLTI